MSSSYYGRNLSNSQINESTKSPRARWLSKCFLFGVLGFNRRLDNKGNTVFFFYTSDHLLREFNYSYIVLIPKSNQAVEFKDYRPIDLCNLIYKLISKILANRMRPILKRIIAPTQATFVLGKWIHENGLLAQELVATVKKKKGRGGLMGIKLDMPKLYDRVE